MRYIPSQFIRGSNLGHVRRDIFTAMTKFWRVIDFKNHLKLSPKKSKSLRLYTFLQKQEGKKM